MAHRRRCRTGPGARRWRRTPALSRPTTPTRRPATRRHRPTTELDGTEALAATDRADDPTADELAPTAEATEDATIELDTGIDNAAPPGENAGLDQLDNLTDLADFAAAAVGAPPAPDVPAATSAASDEELSEAETYLAEAELPRCLGVDLVVGPAVYGDVPVVVGIDESRDLAIAYRAANCAEVARVRLP